MCLGLSPCSSKTSVSLVPPKPPSRFLHVTQGRTHSRELVVDDQLEFDRLLQEPKSFQDCTSLTIVCINNVQMKSHQIQTLIPFLTNLRELTFMNCQIDDDGAQAIADPAQLVNLTSLNLSDNQIGDQGAQAIARATYLVNLTSLNLEYNQLSIVGIQAMTESTHQLVHLTLNLNHNPITHDDAIVRANYFHEKI